MSYVIRHGYPDDAVALANVHDLSWQAAYEGIIPKEEIQRQGQLRLATWQKMLQDENMIVLLSEIEGVIAGFFVMTASKDHSEDEKVLELQAFYFLQEYWSMGYAEHLIKFAINWAKKRKYKSVYCWVLQDNLRARRFYEKNGFYHDQNSKIITIGGVDLTEVRYWNSVRSGDNLWWRLI